MIIRAKNWGEFQHYKDRDPSWIKLHKKLLDNYEFHSLPIASRALAPMLWLLVSESKEGEIEASEQKLAFRLHLSVGELTDALMPLVQSGFFEMEQDAINPLAEAERNAIPEKEEQVEKQEQKELTSADADPSKPEPQPKKAPYPEEYENFWSEYPTDPLMSKKKAYEQWKKLNQQDREAARAAIPGFKDYCKKNATYRPVHAERFISERRFDGFKTAAPDLDPKKLAELQDRIDRKLKRGAYDPMREILQ
jgi:hypothetical protein